MATRATVTPNRRGLRSRERVLDAAERVMAQEGFEAATIARVVAESGIPMSSVYHYYGSKDGVLLAVMERGNERFLADVPDPAERYGSALEHLTALVATVAETLDRHPDFLRLLMVLAVQPPAGEAADEVQAVVGRVRDAARARLRKQMAIAFDEDPRSAAVARLARFALAAFDGSFLAAQADRAAKLSDLTDSLPAALVAVHRSLTT